MQQTNKIDSIAFSASDFEEGDANYILTQLDNQPEPEPKPKSKTKTGQEVTSSVKAHVGNYGKTTRIPIEQLGLCIACFSIEGGVRSFAQYSKAMIDAIGDEIKPYLRSIYEVIRYFPGMEGIAKEMSTQSEIDEYINQQTKKRKKMKRDEWKEHEKTLPKSTPEQEMRLGSETLKSILIDTVQEEIPNLWK